MKMRALIFIEKLEEKLVMVGEYASIDFYMMS
jgi:hypothetical protein